MVLPVRGGWTSRGRQTHFHEPGRAWQTTSKTSGEAFVSRYASGPWPRRCSPSVSAKGLEFTRSPSRAPWAAVLDVRLFGAQVSGSFSKDFRVYNLRPYL